MIRELEHKKAEIERLCRRHHVTRLEIFGSAATGNHREESDFDFLVEFEPLPSGAYADAYFGLLESFERLFGQPVDLVVASAVSKSVLPAVHRADEVIALCGLKPANTSTTSSARLTC